MTDSAMPGPTRLGNYELVRLLAQGGMADIYLAKQCGLERLVAIKVLNRARAADPESCTLFLDEARLLAMLDHENLASVYDVDRIDGMHYLAMEYVHGVDLRELLSACERDQRAVPFETAVAIVMGAAAGLDHAHRRCGPDGRPLHLVHRDVSLSNIMVAHDGGVKVVDFGIAIASVSSHHTNPGIVRGKASYMSPEQALGDAVDLRTDVFALGVVLYELTTGRRCFQGNSDFERMLAVVRGDYAAPSAVCPNFPPALEQVIKTALAIDGSKRYPSARALYEALARVALVEGWRTDARAIVAMMHSLYGNVPVVGQVATAEVSASAIVAEHSIDDAIEIAIAEALRAEDMATPTPTVIITRPRAHAGADNDLRRFARGTEPAPLPAVAPPGSDDWHDEQPTRGRRSVPRMFAARHAA